MVGYYEVHIDSGFGNYGDKIVHTQEISQLASRFENAIFLDPAIVSIEMTEVYDDDLVHPSEEGSRIVENGLQDRIEAMVLSTFQEHMGSIIPYFES